MNIELLQNTFEIVRADSQNFATSFYRNLFTDYPILKALFSNTDLQKQENKLMTALVVIIDNFRNFPYLENLLKSLGERHIKYGVALEHYQMLGMTLLKTLESFLKEQWTLEVKEAWTEAYQTIVDLMLEPTKDKDHLQVDCIPYIPSVFDKLRVEAIAQKGLRDGYSIGLVTQKLMADCYFQEIKQKIGREKTLKLASEIVQNMLHKEGGLISTQKSDIRSSKINGE